ncbi:MAG: hypothetical protein R6U57_07075 [Anaerolineales bacterium]
MFKKRLWGCLLGGAISAALCMSGRQIIFGFPPITWDELAAMVANRLLLGFAIGISGWRIHYLLHGAVMGLIFSLSVSIGFLPADQLPFFLYTSAGVLYGMFIEWLSSDIFKAPLKTA